MCWGDWNDAAFLVESHLVNAYLTVPSRTFLALNEIFVDAVIHDIPLVLAWNLKDGVVGSAVNLLSRTLNQDGWVFTVYLLNRSEWGFRNAVAHVVVRAARVVNRP